jgi:predicted lipoprotein with Yx(FWY)xxD motif
LNFPLALTLFPGPPFNQAFTRAWRVGTSTPLKRVLIILATVLLIATLPAALAGASGRRAKLQLRTTKLGAILVNGHGFTLYAFTRDIPRRDACVKVKGCLRAWPAVTTSGKPIAGSGVSASLIGTIKVKGIGLQVTYAGHPLYTYIGDRHPGATYYVNRFQFGGRWPALDGAGDEIK